MSGAFAFDQVTNRMAPDLSAKIPVWAIAGEGAEDSATTFPSVVTHSPFWNWLISLVTGACRNLGGDAKLPEEFIGNRPFRLSGWDPELLDELL